MQSVSSLHASIAENKISPSLIDDDTKGWNAGESRTIVSCSLKDAHALADRRTSESLVIGWIYGREESDVHAKGLVRPTACFANGLAQRIGVRLRKCRENA